VLHDLLQRGAPLKNLVGHSKGALVIANAARGLEAGAEKPEQIVTLGCPVGESDGTVYHQYLGVWDGLGRLNSWGHWPSKWVDSDHSTNTWWALAMSAQKLAGAALLLAV
jgi:hypothetical protein